MQHARLFSEFYHDLGTTNEYCQDVVVMDAVLLDELILRLEPAAQATE